MALFLFLSPYNALWTLEMVDYAFDVRRVNVAQYILTGCENSVKYLLVLCYFFTVFHRIGVV